MRRRPLIISLALHAALVAAVLQCQHPAPTRAPPALSIETVTLPPPVRLAPAPAPAPTASPSGSGTRARTRARARSPSPGTAISAETLGTTEIATGRAGGEGGTGGTGGTGSGHGPATETRDSGRGIMIIGGLDVEHPPSKARPPRLLYPARERPEREGHVFIASLSIDTDGYVVGVRLLRGFGGRRDDKASSAVWRFRYDPARRRRPPHPRPHPPALPDRLKVRGT